MKNKILNFREFRLAKILILGVAIYLAFFAFTNMPQILLYSGYMLYIFPLLICVGMHLVMCKFMHKGHGKH